MDKDDAKAKQNSFLDKLMTGMMDKYGPQVPVCYFCKKQVLGTCIDWIDPDRESQKVCVPCVFKAINYLDFAIKNRIDIQ